MDIRKIIREEVQKIFKEQENSIVGGALTDIGTEIQKDLDNVGKIVQTHQTDMKNKDIEIKTDGMLKSKLDAQSPQRKGLEREIPEMQKDYKVREKQLKDLQNAQKGMADAKKEIEKQKAEIEKNTSTTTTTTTTADGSTETKPPSVLPSLPSAI